ncbi:MAG: O-antigen ligase family protein [Planctomycetota bacterium]
MEAVPGDEHAVPGDGGGGDGEAEAGFGVRAGGVSSVAGAGGRGRRLDRTDGLMGGVGEVDGVGGDALSRWVASRWFAMLGVVLVGYLVAGRGFAYLGVRPLFIGELTLAAGLATVLVLRRSWAAMGLTINLLIGAMLVWAAARTLPYLGTYGISAPRDAVALGYALLAVVVSAVVIEHPWLLRRALDWVRRAAPWVIVMLTGAVVLCTVAKGVIPEWPGTGIRVIDTKVGDPLVHVGGLAVLLMLGFTRLRGWLWALPLGGMFGVLGMMSRGAMLATLAAVGLATVFYPRSEWLPRALLIGLGVLTVVIVVDPVVTLPGRERQVSVEQAVQNVVSIVGDSNTGDLSGTKSWRLDWWEKIVGYTFGGDYFWTGKGFGVNLANVDGFQVFEDESLRSPHNAAMTVLARAGVPGLAMWSAVHLVWLGMMIGLYRRARLAGQEAWARLAVALVAYWLALHVHAAFDVYFEGPMGGFWVWSVMGLGVGAAWVQRCHPEVLRDEEVLDEAVQRGALAGGHQR